MDRLDTEKTATDPSTPQGGAVIVITRCEKQRHWQTTFHKRGHAERESSRKNFRWDLFKTSPAIIFLTKEISTMAKARKVWFTAIWETTEKTIKMSKMMGLFDGFFGPMSEVLGLLTANTVLFHVYIERRRRIFDCPSIKNWLLHLTWLGELEGFRQPKCNKPFFFFNKFTVWECAD